MKIMDNDRPLSYWHRIAEQNGISRRTFNYRAKRGMAPRAAATTPLLKVGGRKIDPNSDQQISLAAGLSINAVNGYKQRHPDTTLSAHEIVEKLIKNKQRISIEQKAKAANLNAAMVRSRLSNGWDEKDAYKPKLTPQESARRAAKQRGINRQKAHAERLQRASQRPQQNNALTQ